MRSASSASTPMGGPACEKKGAEAVVGGVVAGDGDRGAEAVVGGVVVGDGERGAERVVGRVVAGDGWAQAASCSRGTKTSRPYAVSRTGHPAGTSAMLPAGRWTTAYWAVTSVTSAR